MKIKKIHVIYIIFIIGCLAIGLFFTSIIQEGLDNTTRTIGILEPVPVGFYEVSRDIAAKTKIIHSLLISTGDPMPVGYYCVSISSIDPYDRTIAKIPYGYIATGDPDAVQSLRASTTSSQLSTAPDPNAMTSADANANVPDGYTIDTYNKLTSYDASSIDVSYNSGYNERDDANQATTWILDQAGNKISVPWSSVRGDITYYAPGTYPYGPSNYVPNYEDSVYLSRTTGESTVSPIYNTASMLGGFCSQNKNNPTVLESTCKLIDVDKCGSTSCCVLLGGSKCVAGDANGPTMKVNYSDILIQNKDYYYYQGKCYGNCP